MRETTWSYRSAESEGEGVVVGHGAFLRLLGSGRLDLDADEVKAEGSQCWMKARDALAILEIHRLHTKPPRGAAVLVGVAAAVIASLASATAFHFALSADSRLGESIRSGIEANLSADPRFVEKVAAHPLKLSEADTAAIAKSMSRNSALQPSGASETLRTRRVEIVDDAGRVRLSLGAMTGGGIGETVLDEHAVERIRVCVEGNGTARWRLLSHDGKPAVSASTWPKEMNEKERGGLTVYQSDIAVANGETEHIRARLSEDSIQLFDAEDKERVLLKSDNGSGWGGLWLSSPKDSNNAVITLAVNKEGIGGQLMSKGAGTVYSDSNGVQRVQIGGTSAPGTSGVFVKDKEGRGRIILYGAEDGSATQYMTRGTDLAFGDNADKTRVSIRGDNGKGVAALSLSAGGALAGITLIACPQGESSVNLFDRNGAERVSLNMLQSGTANAVVRGRDGNAAWFAESDAGGGFKNYLRRSRDEQVMEQVGQAVDGFNRGYELSQTLRKLFGDR